MCYFIALLSDSLLTREFLQNFNFVIIFCIYTLQDYKYFLSKPKALLFVLFKTFCWNFSSFRHVSSLFWFLSLVGSKWFGHLYMVIISYLLRVHRESALYNSDAGIPRLNPIFTKPYNNKICTKKMFVMEVKIPTFI